ncbi:hypothetical protein NDU88_003151 [Pleurodeles waltl]|uniref:Uncharacterized protein n=1 Tax=Pleurodeles waltl TaxID=8319 RepID=A0AAV7WSR5_PLEWA|nr:hypothetical protein NDU88_003151 [Pleurodeles waltl]
MSIQALLPCTLLGQRPATTGSSEWPERKPHRGPEQKYCANFGRTKQRTKERAEAPSSPPTPVSGPIVGATRGGHPRGATNPLKKGAARHPSQVQVTGQPGGGRHNDTTRGPLIGATRPSPRDSATPGTALQQTANPTCILQRQAHAGNQRGDRSSERRDPRPGTQLHRAQLRSRQPTLPASFSDEHTQETNEGTAHRSDATLAPDSTTPCTASQQTANPTCILQRRAHAGNQRGDRSSERRDPRPGTQLQRAQLQNAAAATRQRGTQSGSIGTGRGTRPPPPSCRKQLLTFSGPRRRKNAARPTGYSRRGDVTQRQYTTRASPGTAPIWGRRDPCIDQVCAVSAQWGGKQHQPKHHGDQAAREAATTHSKDWILKQIRGAGSSEKETQEVQGDCSATNPAGSEVTPPETKKRQRNTSRGAERGDKKETGERVEAATPGPSKKAKTSNGEQISIIVKECLKSMAPLLFVKPGGGASRRHT